MGQIIGEILPLAVGVAISPVPIAAVIVMLFTPRAKSNGPAFLVGWVLGILVVGTVVLLIPGLEATDGEPSTTTGAVKGVLGILLLAVGVRLWRKRPPPGEPAEPPGWMAKVDEFGLGASLGMGFVLSGLNPKNLLLVVAAGATISASDLSTGQQIGALLIFAAIAASTVAVPVIGYLIAGNRAEQTLAEAKDWLIQNNATVMGVLVLVLGVSLVGDAIRILFG